MLYVAGLVLQVKNCGWAMAAVSGLFISIIDFSVNLVTVSITAEHRFDSQIKG